MAEGELAQVKVIQTPESFVGVDIFQAAMAHPDVPFELAAIATAHPDLLGKRFGETYLAGPPQLKDVPFISATEARDNTDAPVVFAGSSSNLAASRLPDLAAGRLLVPLNVSSRQPDTPVVNAFVNGTHIDELYAYDAADKVINSGNSLASVVSVPLAPLHRAIGIESIAMDTLQGWSDTGMRHVPSLLADSGTDSEIDAHPIHKSKREGIQRDIQRLLGSSVDTPADIGFSHMNLRHGSWQKGHYAKITARFTRDTSKEEIEDEWRHFEAPEAVSSIRSQLKVISQLGGERWPRGHQKIMPVKLEHGDGMLLRSDAHMTRIRHMHPMRVMAHILSFDAEDPRSLTFELTGDSIVEGGVGNGLLNALYARAQGYV